MRDDLADGHGTRCGVTGSVGGDALGLKAEEQTEIPIGESEDEPAIVKHAVVAGVRADIALIEMNVMDAVQAVGVSELDVDRFVQIAIELRAEGVDLAARVLALIDVEGEQIL